MNVVRLKTHTLDHGSPSGFYKCDQCNKEFNEEWKMSAHRKIHTKYQCDQCEKSFQYLDIKKKHILVTHEKTKLYCHFFNNRKTCPYDDRCVFLHEDLEML